MTVEAQFISAKTNENGCVQHLHAKDHKTGADENSKCSLHGTRDRLPLQPTTCNHDQNGCSAIADNNPLNANLSQPCSHPRHPLQKMLEYNSKWADQVDSKVLAENAKKQTPAVLWIGCADSRLSEAILTGVAPGEVFVHRNIANCYHPGDPSAEAVLAYAVHHLKVRHVVVVGHYGCGGICAAMESALARDQDDDRHSDVPPSPDAVAIDNWLKPLRSMAVAQLRSGGPAADLNPEEAHRLLARMHTVTQAANIESSEIVKQAERGGHKITVDAWIYDIGVGRLIDLEV